MTHPKTEPPQPVCIVTQDADTGAVMDIKNGDYALKPDREWIRRHVDWAMRHNRTVIVTPRNSHADVKGTQDAA